MEAILVSMVEHVMRPVTSLGNASGANAVLRIQGDTVNLRVRSHSFTLIYLLLSFSDSCKNRVVPNK